MLCGEALLVKLAPQEIGARLLRCRSWSCEICHEDRRRGLQAQAHRGQPTRFITLTVNPAFFASPLERAQRLVEAWRRVRLRTMRRYRMKRLPFLAVFEATKKGEPHLHILARFKWIDRDWLSKQMQEEIGAWCVDVRAVKEQKEIAAYIAKYVGKAAHHFGTLKRYWASADYEIKSEPEEAGLAEPFQFEIRLQDTMHEFIDRLAAMGCEVVVGRHWAIFEGAPPGSSRRYGWMDRSA